MCDFWIWQGVKIYSDSCLILWFVQLSGFEYSILVHNSFSNVMMTEG